MNNMPGPLAPSQSQESLQPVNHEVKSSEEVVQSNEEIQAPIIEKPTINDPNESNNMVNVSNLSPKGIEVVATRKGFYNQTRIDKFQKFKVRGFEELGEWMECVDPALEKKRVEKFKLKKAKQL